MSRDPKPEVKILNNQMSKLKESRNKTYPASGVTLKVALIGPRKAGKTRIANQLANLVVPSEDKYEATAGVRILEFEKQITSRKNGVPTADMTVGVELWDCSGDQKFEKGCWPAIMKDLMGIVVVFDPTSKAQANDVHVWCEWFCKVANLQDDQAAIFAHGNLTSRHKPLRVKAGNRKVSVPIVNVQYRIEGKEKPFTSETEFNHFLGGLYQFHPQRDWEMFTE